MSIFLILLILCLILPFGAPSIRDAGGSLSSHVILNAFAIAFGLSSATIVYWIGKWSNAKVRERGDSSLDRSLYFLYVGVAVWAVVSLVLTDWIGGHIAKYLK